MLRIVITGAHSVGKTTLANRLREHLPDIGITSVLAEEPIRVIRRNYPEVICKPDTLYLRLLEEHFRRLHSLDCACCLYDRSLVDLLAYSRLEGPDNPAFIALITELLPWYARFIDLFFYLPIEFPLVADGCRPLSEAYRTKADEMIKTVASEAAISLKTINGSIEERTLKAIKAIKANNSF